MSDAAAGFHVGQLVDVVDYGLATVSCLESTESKYLGRVQVTYDNGTKYWAQATKTEQRVLVSPTTRQYKMAWVHNATPRSICLEIGCHEGHTTAMLHKRVKSLVGVDLSSQTVDMARQSHPQCRFEVCDGFDVARLRTFSPRSDGGYDIIGVDIGGIAALDKVVALVSALMKEFKPASPEFPQGAKLLVKSIHLVRFLQMSEVFRFDEHRQWALAPEAAQPKAQLLVPEIDRQPEKEDDELALS